jgi:L-ascorbate metabolism protein UlaG (beta-lactamase superfamily)
MRILWRILLGMVLLVAVAAGWIVFQMRTIPDLGAYRSLALEAPTSKPGSLVVTFLGVSTLLLNDGETAILTDGFFTRPGLREIFLNKIAPDKALIARHLKHAGIERLAAVIVNHSHYDHAMDAPEVALQTGALLVGSESTANVGRGWGLPEERIRVKLPGETMDFGAFRVTLLPSGHMPTGYPTGEITAPIIPPARANAYLMGTNYAVLVEHRGKTLLINASAGFAAGALAGRHADVVFLGIGALGKRDIAYMEAYWHEVVEATGARRVIPVHWDNLTLPLDEPLTPIPHLMDDFDATMRFLLAKGAAQDVEVRLPQAWQKIEPFPPN